MAVHPLCVRTIAASRAPALQPASCRAMGSTTSSRESVGTGRSRGETAGNGGGGGGAVRAFLDALASGSGASRCERASASDNNAARARSGFVFLRRPAEPVQQASRAGGSLVSNAHGVEADAQPVNHVMEWEPCSAPACRRARPPHTAHFGSRPKHKPSAAISTRISRGIGFGPQWSA